MLGWCIVLFVLGVFNILQDAGAVGAIGQAGRVTTSALMLAVIGLLFRVKWKEEEGEKEKLMARVRELEERIRSMRR
ncbi:MAG: hypothetical protein PHN82_11025 [bacterium]|nr:hypothetical protein [bacterium]